MQLKSVCLAVAAGLLVMGTAIPHPPGVPLLSVSPKGSIDPATHEGNSGVKSISVDVDGILDRRAYSVGHVSKTQDEKNQDQGDHDESDNVVVDLTTSEGMNGKSDTMIEKKELGDELQAASSPSDPALAFNPRAAKPPQINSSNAPDPRLACPICDNLVKKCKHDCKGHLACADYCLCKLKQTDINCMVCTSWEARCQWPG